MWSFYKYLMIAGSPYRMGDQFIIKVKCPLENNTVKNYLKNTRIKIFPLDALTGNSKYFSPYNDKDISVMQIIITSGNMFLQYQFYKEEKIISKKNKLTKEDFKIRFRQM